MEKNRQKTESTQCQPEMQSAGASTQPTLNQHPLKEYSKYVTFNVMGMIGVSCYILADTFFVSKALGAQGLAALNLALPIFNAIRGIDGYGWCYLVFYSKRSACRGRSEPDIFYRGNGYISMLSAVHSGRSVLFLTDRFSVRS